MPNTFFYLYTKFELPNISEKKSYLELKKNKEMPIFLKIDK